MISSIFLKIRRLRIVTAILVIALTYLNFSTTYAGESPSGALKKLKKNYQKIESLHAEFREVFRWEMTGETSVREGEMMVTNTNRFRITSIDQIVVSDGVNIYRYNRISNQVIIEPISESSSPMIPQQILLDFAKEFEAINLSNVSVAGKSGFRIDLKPKNREETLLNAATIWATEGDNVVHRLKLIDLNGNSTTFFLSDILINSPVDSSFSLFSIPEGAEVFDMR